MARTLLWRLAFGLCDWSEGLQVWVVLDSKVLKIWNGVVILKKFLDTLSNYEKIDNFKLFNE